MNNPNNGESSVGKEVSVHAVSTSALATEAPITALGQMMQYALEEPMPIVKNLLLNGADLLEMAVHLKKVITDVSKHCHDVEGVEKLQPCMDTYLRTCKQAERILRLQHEIKTDR